MGRTGNRALNMHINFSVLPMTELRTRPGEILDRVADHGEAFLIERNGQRKACLVPLGVFLPDIAPERIADEIQELEKNGEQPRTTVTQEREIAFLFPRIDKRDAYDITIVLPHTYPNACPKIFVDDLDSGAPHRWADGALCVFGVMSSWNPGKHTAAFALELARRWILRYESWKKTGEWPNPERSDG